jgi:predicted methyltransferase
MVKINNAAALAHFFTGAALKTGDTAVDATAGNGHDTLFLAQAVGESGRVYAFDVQDEAVESTRGRLMQSGLSNVSLIRDSHAHIARYVNEEISAAVFNLGYLPGSASGVTTHPETTISAVRQCLELLKPAGIICICLYTGHEGGREEYTAVSGFLSGLDAQKYDVLNILLWNKSKEAPVVMLVQKNT